MDDAGKVVRSMIRLMGGEQGTELEPWREITDPAGNRYYIFQQMQGDTTVLGGAVKVITDAESPQDFLKKMIIKTTGGDRFEIPASGLDNLTLEENIASMMNTTEETEDDTVAMSRPKG